MTADPDSTARKDGETRRPAGGWSREDLAFAAAELGREFPNVTAGRAAAAVAEAAKLIAPAEGRVRLLQGARRSLRTG